MASILELLNDGPAVETNPALPDSPGQFQQGLRSGGLGAGSQLRALAGGAAEVLGFDNFAQDQYAASRGLQADAQAAGPRISSYKDVGNLRDAYDYTTGLLGGSVPTTGVALAAALGGRTPVGAALRATAATTPMEAGDVVQRQQADPVSLREGAGDRFMQALGAGAVSAGVQSIVPAVVAGKVVGRAATGAAAADKSVLGMLGTGAKTVAGEGLTEGAGEVVKQAGTMISSPDKAFDTDAIMENVVGGAVAGGALGGVGAAADLARKGASAAPGAVQKLIPESVETDDVAQRLRAVHDNVAGNAKDYLSRVAAGEDIADVEAVRGFGADTDKVAAAIPGLDAERVAKVKAWGEEMLAKGGLTPERQAEVSAAMGDLGNKAAQQVVARAKQGQEMAIDFAGKAKALFEQFKPKKAAAEGGAKKSEDFSGIRQAIIQEIAPAISAKNPQLLESTESINQVADAVRMMIERTSSGDRGFTPDQLMSLIDVLGDSTADVMDSVWNAVVANGDAVSAEQTQAFFGTLNRISEIQKSNASLTDTLRKNLLQPDTANDEQLAQEAQVLRAYAARPARAELSEKAKFNDERVRFMLDQRYGKNTDAVLAAVEKDVKASQTRNQLDKEDVAEGADVDRDAATTLREREEADVMGEPVYYGRKNGKRFDGLALNPDIDPAGDKGQAVQALARATKENPDRSVSFLSADALGKDHPSVQTMRKQLMAQFMEADEALTEAQVKKLVDQEIKKYGMVTAEGSRQETAITRDDLEKLTVKGEGEKAKSSHLKNPGTIRTGDGGTVYDSVKLTEFMEKKFKNAFNGADNKSVPHRTGRMFMEGVAALQDHLGKSFEIPDGTVISKSGLTWGQVKGLDMSPGEGKGAGERLGQHLDALRAQYKDAKAKGANEKELGGIAREAAKAKGEFEFTRDAELAAEGKNTEQDDEDGKTDVDPRGNIHQVERMTGGNVQPLQVDEAGGTLLKSNAPIEGRLKDEQVSLLRTKLQALGKSSAGAKAVAVRAEQLLDNASILNASAHKRLAGLLNGARASDVASVVNALHEKYKNQMAVAKADAAAKPEAIDNDELMDMVTRESYGGLNTRAKVDAFMKQGRELYADLKKRDKADEDFSKAEEKAYGVLDGLFGKDSRADLDMFYSELDDAAPEVAAKGPKAEAAAYASTLKSSKQGVNQTTGTHTAADRAAVRAHIDKVLGPSIKTVFKKIFHAGEFEEVGPDGVIRISVHATNPMSVAYHESVHALFSKLLGQGNSEVTRVLMKAAQSAPVLNQLKRLLAGEPAALAQLKDPEEAAAYMYQFWAAGQLTVGTHTKSVFEKIADAIRQVLGIWSNDQRALEVMEYFHRGDFKANAANPSAVARALIESGRNQALEQAKALTKPLYEMGEAVLSAGGERLRDTGVPALREIADAMKLHGTKAGEDAGFLPAARAERTRVMNAIGAKLGQFTKPQIEEALEAMQKGVQAASPEGRLAQRAVQGANGLLPQMLEYMRDAGVNVAGLDIDTKYFPRVWDTSFIAAHQKEFLNMLGKYQISGQLQGDPREILNKLMAADGNEFTVEVNKPGMQALKKRVLDFVTDADAAPFARKDLYEILDSYVTQATRRAEWARRFGDQGERLGDMITRAKKEGASAEDIEMTWKYVKAVDGTLGDTIDPNIRRLMGNMIVYQNIRLLPLAIFASVVDPLGIVVRGGTVKEAFDTFTRGVKEVANNFKKEVKADAQTQMAELIGTIDDATLVHTLGATYSQGMVGDTGRKINDAFFRFNLMEQFNRSMRVGATQAALSFMARHADGTASPHSERWMQELGYEKGEYDPAVLDDKAKAAVNRWVDGAVLRPDAADKPIWMSDPRYMLVSHLKQFTYSFQQTILKRVAHEHRNGNYAPSMALASYVPMMIAADLIKGMIQGGGETPQWKKGWGAGEYVGSGIERAGLLGVGQFAVDTAQMGPVGALGGPTVGQLWDAAKVAGGAKEGGSFVLKSMPANALYGGFAKDGDGGAGLKAD
jgi:hypothetical protein